MLPPRPTFDTLWELQKLMDFRYRVSGAGLRKLETWLWDLRMRVSRDEEDQVERRNPEPHLANKALARKRLGTVERELRWRRQGTEGPFR